MRILIALILFLSWCVHATTFTEFYCDTSNGSTNINAGSTTNATPVYSAVNGNWDGTSVYTPTDGSTPANTVSAGMWAAIFIDGSTNLIQTSAGGCVMLITNVAAGANGAITFDRSAFMGTAPSSSATGRSINVGGCWNGPYGIIGFPFGFASHSGTNGPTAMPRINFRNTSQYNVTAAMTQSTTGPMRFQGMTTTAGDGGKATIDGGTSGNYYILLTMSGANIDVMDFIFANNGGTSTSQHGVVASGHGQLWLRCVFHDFAIGLRANAIIGLVECEAYACNKANTANMGAFVFDTAAALGIRCIAHDNSAGANCNGFYISASVTLVGCISDSNGGNGFRSSLSGSPCWLMNCVAWNNSGSGYDMTFNGAQAIYCENSAFLKNATQGVVSSGNNKKNGLFANCVFGSGTQTNTLGNYKVPLVETNYCFAYTSDSVPWVDSTNGNFTLSAAASLVKANGAGSFTETAASYSGTVSYPDIGASQSASTNSTAATAAGGAYPWAQ